MAWKKPAKKSAEKASAKEKPAKEKPVKEKAAKKKPAEKKEPHAELPPELAHEGMAARATHWIREEGPWWVCSFVFHLVVVCSLALVSGKVVEKIVDEAPSFEEATLDKPVDVPQEIERFEVGETPEDPTELDTDTLELEKPAQITQEARYYDDSATFAEAGGGMAATTEQPSLGGLGGFDFKGIGAGPAVKGAKGGVGVGVGTGTQAGSGGSGWGFGGRGSGSRKAMLGSGGGTRQSERAVAGALNWIARHQSPDGSWNLVAYKARCKDPSCESKAASDRPAAATALALLPFLAAGQTHKSPGRYKPNIYAGIAYLVKNQKKDGDLRMGGNMYDHGLASIALCECYGMSGDNQVGRAAQGALNFIMEAQDPAGGGWRYDPRTPGDTSVVGWQLMALKSGQMSYLNVNPVVFERAKAYLKSVSKGKNVGSLGASGLFSYVPNSGPSPAMTAAGLLALQYLGAERTDPAMIEGTAFLMGNQPSAGGNALYYWYYATQVMHNQPGPDWDTWNRNMRRTLIDTQIKEDKCAAGSWDTKLDAHGDTGGRLYVTSLAALTLEVYYRYLPLYKLDKEGAAPPGKAAPAAADKK